MRLNRLGQSDLRVSEVCLGSMTWGEQNSEADAHAQRDYAVSRGVNFIDTAEMYPVPPRGETQGRTEALLAYSALGFGHLTGKYLHGALPEGARLMRFPAFGQRYTKVNVPEAVAAYAELAKSIGRSPAVLALAFVRSRWFTASTIIGATGLAQLKENLDAATLDLDAATLAQIDEIHQRYPNPAL